MKFMLSVFLLSCINIACFAKTISPNLSAEYDGRRKNVSIKWQNTDDRASRFILQRSDDNNKWKDIYVLESSNFSNKKLEKFSDDNPEQVKNYYRLKIVMNDNSADYSLSIMVQTANPLESWTMFPVPVKDFLNLQYIGSEPIKGVVCIFIQNMSGYVNIRKRCSSLSRTIQIPVNNLGKGAYNVRIIINNEVVWNQQFVK